MKLRIIKDTAAFAASNVAVQTLGLFLAVWIRRALGPAAMGQWALLQTFLKYVSFLNLGIVRAVGRRVPMLKGANAEAEAAEIKRAGFTYVVLSSSCVGLVIAAASFFVVLPRYGENWFWFGVTLAVMNVIERVNNYWVNFLYAEKRFQFASRLKIYSALFNVSLVLPLVYFFRLYGLYAATVLSLAFNVAFMRWKGRIGFEMKVDGRIPALVKEGIPLFLFSVAFGLFVSLDRVLIARFVGLAELGAYTIATLAAEYLFTVPNMFQTVLYPSVLEKFGAADVAGREKYSVMPARLIAAYFALFAGALAAVAPWFCQTFLPAFTAGLPALKILVFGYAFVALTQQMSHVLIGTGAYKRLWPITVGLIAATIAFVVLYTKSGGGVTGVACVMTAAFCLNYLIFARMALVPLFGRAVAAAEIAKNCAHLALGAAVLVVLESVWPSSGLLPSALKAAVCAGTVLAYLRAAERHYRIFEAVGDLKTAWKNRKAAAAKA